jgi:sulfatase maturation enzyme AslB (radical SAM superfamily)
MIDTFRPCCRFPLNQDNQYPTTDDILSKGQSAFNNDFLTTLRQDMLEGKPRVECSKCYIEEQSNVISMRQKGNFQFTSSAVGTGFEKLEFLEISLDNLCNLECRMCNSRFSTKLNKRDELLNQEGLVEFKSNTVKYKTLELMDVLDLRDLKMIKLLGGEPLISPSLVTFLEKIPNPENVEILIITNATTIPSQSTLDKLKTFKSVRFDFSIDGIYQYNDYQRVGSNFETLISNSLFLANYFPNQHSVHSVFSSLNILGLDQSVSWFEKHLPFTLSIDIVSNNILSPFHSPDWYKNLILEKINDSNTFKTYVKNLFDSKHCYDSKKWNEFLKFCRITDNIYDTDITKINPFLAKAIQDVNVCSD